MALLWLWRRLAAVAPIQPLAQDLPYALSVALKKAKRKKKKRKKKEKWQEISHSKEMHVRRVKQHLENTEEKKNICPSRTLPSRENTFQRKQNKDLMRNVRESPSKRRKM